MVSVPLNSLNKEIKAITKDELQNLPSEGKDENTFLIFKWNIVWKEILGEFFFILVSFLFIGKKWAISKALVIWGGVKREMGEASLEQVKPACHCFSVRVGKSPPTEDPNLISSKNSDDIQRMVEFSL